MQIIRSLTQLKPRGEQQIRETISRLALGTNPSAEKEKVTTVDVRSGIMLDCGSGHTSVLWYGLTEGELPIRQLRRSKLKLPGGGNFKITDVFTNSTVSLVESGKSFAAALRAEIGEATEKGTIPAPAIIYVGATGGLREGLDKGTIQESSLIEFRSALLGGLPKNSSLVVITGEEEAAWELAAANIIYGPSIETMFPNTTEQFGLFSGGGSSMQVQASSGVPYSWPFSTWCEEFGLDEEKGAATDAWLDGAKWGLWEASLLAKLDNAVSSFEKRKFTGCFVITAMNHVAATAAGFAEIPITAAGAIKRLRAALTQFKRGVGEPFQGFVDGKHAVHPTVYAWYCSMPPHHLARVGAMHICRLAHVLEKLFEPEARLFAPPATNVSGGRLDCEWTLEAYACQVKALKSQAQ
jgi:hypothetical protein